MKRELLATLREEIGDCHRCRLGEGRNQLVFGDGNPNAQLMLVGEGPGADEDKEGLPFVGKSGALIGKWLKDFGLKREDIYINNIVMSRPPNNRPPEKDEVETCLPFLMRRIEIIQPKVIITLGSTAARALLNTGEAIGKLRGKLYKIGNISLIPTYHPSYILRGNSAAEKLVYEDFTLAMIALGGSNEVSLK